MFSPKPYKDADFGSLVEISRYWSLNTRLLKTSDESAVVLKRTSLFDFRLTAKPNGFDV